MKIDMGRVRVFLGIILINISYYSSLSFFAIYLTETFSVSLSTVGLLLGVNPFCMAFAGFYGGKLADRYQHRILLIIALVVTVVSYATMALVMGLWVFAMCNAALGMSRGFFDVVFKVHILQHPAHKANNLSLRAISINIGAACGPTIGFLLLTWNPQAMFWVGALLNALTIFLLYPVITANARNFDERKLPSPKIFHYRSIICAALAVTGCLMIYSQLDSTVPLWLKSYKGGYGFYSLLLTINAVSVIIFQMPLSFFIKTLNKFYLLMFSLSLFVVALGGIFLIQNMVVTVLCVIILGVAEVLVFQISYILVDAISPDGGKGLYAGISNLDVLGLAAGPALGCFIFDYFGNVGVFIMTVGVVLISTLFYHGLRSYHFGDKKW